MPAAKPLEFRRRALELVRQGERPARVASDLGISESCVRRGMARDDIDAGRKEGVHDGRTSGARRSAASQPGSRDGDRDPQACQRLLRQGERAPKIGFRLVRELSRDGIPVAVACRKLKVSRAGYYEWWDQAPSARDIADAALTDMICRIHRDSRGNYGAKRVHDELSIEHGVRCGRKRVARLLAQAGLRGVSHVRKNRSWRPAPAPHDDLVRRQFRADAPDRVWFTDITQHRATDGWVYC